MHRRRRGGGHGAPRGETFRGSVVDVTEKGGLVQISDPAILASADGECSAGDEVTAKLIEADVDRRRVQFQVVERGLVT